MKATEFRQLIKEALESEIDEMARIPTLVKMGENEKATQELLTKYKGTWVADLINTVQTSENGISQPELATAVGKTRQQDINPWIRKFMEAGIFTLEDLATPKKTTGPVNPGVLGRPKTVEGTKKDVAKAFMLKLKANPEYQADEEEIKILGDDVQKIKDLIAAGGVQKGRRPGGSMLPDLSLPSGVE